MYVIIKAVSIHLKINIIMKSKMYGKNYWWETKQGGCHSNKHCTTICDRGQNRFSILTVDFYRNFVLTTDLVPFIFAIFSCTTYSRSFERAGKTA